VVLGLAFGGSFAGDDVTLEGSYVWNKEDEQITGDLRAVFTEKSKEEWNVSFHFDWEEEPRVFTGTASGNLSTGKLEGDIVSDDEDHKMTFKFQGSFEDGTFTGTHGFVSDEGEVKPAGTLTLQPKG
jgi:hypothetical protein